MKIRMPQLSESDNGAQLVKWLVPKGGRVKKDQEIAEVVTDKAVFEIPAPCGGVLKTVKEEGDKVSVGEMIAEIIEGEER